MAGPVRQAGAALRALAVIMVLAGSGGVGWGQAPVPAGGGGEGALAGQGGGDRLRARGGAAMLIRDSRAGFAAEVARGLALPAGSQALVEGRRYRAEPKATAIADLPGWVPAEPDGALWPEHFGGRADCTGIGKGAWPEGTDSAPSVQAAVAHGAALNRPFVIQYGNGRYCHRAQVDLSAARHPVVIRGMGIKNTEIHPGPFGADKAVFLFGQKMGARDHRVEFLRISSTRRAIAHPIAIKAAGRSGVKLRHLHIAGLGATAIWANDLYNDEWENVRVFGCGIDVPEFRLPGTVRFSTTAGDRRLTASEPVFTPAMLGKPISVQQRGVVQDGVPYSGLTAVVAGYDGPSQVTLDRPAYATAKGMHATFYPPTATLAADLRTVTFSRAVLTPQHEGKYLYLDGAAGDGGTHVSTFTYVDGQTAWLTVPAGRTVRDAFAFFTPSLHLGSRFFDSSPPINDHVISDLHIELPRGIGVFAEGGLNLFFERYKMHGQPIGDRNNGWSGPALWLDDVKRASVDGAQWEFGQHGTSLGYVVMTGGKPQAILDKIQCGGPNHGAYLVDFRPTITEEASLAIGAVQTPHDWSLMAGLVNMNGLSKSNSMVSVQGPIQGYRAGLASWVEGAATAPSFGSFRTYLADDEAIGLKLPADFGKAMVYTSSTRSFVELYYRANGTPTLHPFAEGPAAQQAKGELHGKSGADGAFTYALEEGRLFLENRTGTGLSVSVTFLGL